MVIKPEIFDKVEQLAKEFEETPHPAILEKWPLCVIEGESVTKEQALEIIQRTDLSLSGSFVFGNGLDFKEQLKEVLKMPKKVRKKPEENEVEWAKRVTDYLYLGEKYQIRRGYLELDYLYNDWVSSSFIDGPFGWMNPDGKIQFANNIGKWPSTSEVYRELLYIAFTFPYLNMTVTIMDNCKDWETKSIVSFKVENGNVTMLEEPIPIEQLHYKEWKMTEEELEDYITNYNPDNFESYEQTFTIDEIKKWKMKIFDDNYNEVPNKYFPQNYNRETGEII